jgi:hypothetical protein
MGVELEAERRADDGVELVDQAHGPLPPLLGCGLTVTR